jgi:hypothetical protein
MTNSEERVSIVSNLTRKGGYDTRLSKKASPKKKKTKKEPRFPTKPKAKNIDRNDLKLFFEVPISEWREGRFMEAYDDAMVLWELRLYGECDCTFCQRSYCWADEFDHQNYSYYG